MTLLHRNAPTDALADTAMSVLGRLNKAMAEPAPLTVAAFGDFIKRDAGRWAGMARMSSARAEQ